MNFTDTLGLGMSYLKKHKLRFCFNTISIAILLLMVFCLCSFCASLYSTVNQDIKQHLQDKNNRIEFTLNGTQINRQNYSVTLDESSMFLSKLEKYGSVVKSEVIRNTDKKLGFKDVPISIPISIMQEQNNSTLLEGAPWSNSIDNENCIWLTKDVFDGIKSIDVNFQIGNAIEVNLDKSREILIVKGMVKGENSLYLGKTYLIGKNILYISYVNYSLTLPDSSPNNVKKLYSLTRLVDNKLDKDIQQAGRISNNEITYYQSVSSKTSFYLAGVIALILYLTILILGVLKNNAMINIYDNIDTFSIMRCLGLENKKLVQLSMIESSFSITTSTIIAGVASFAFSKLVKLSVNFVLKKDLFNSVLAEYNSAWWVILFYFAVLIILLFFYFTLSLTKSLRRKNLFKTLKNRG